MTKDDDEFTDKFTDKYTKKQVQKSNNTIASYIGYGRKNGLCNLTYLLSYPKSRDAIASKKIEE